MSFIHKNQSAATIAFPITESDVAEVSPPTRGLYIGGEGNITVVMAGGGDPVEFVGLAVGVIHPLQVRKVMAATTATSIVGVR
jgi:hypothetical protein